MTHYAARMATEGLTVVVEAYRALPDALSAPFHRTPSLSSLPAAAAAGAGRVPGRRAFEGEAEALERELVCVAVLGVQV